MLLKCDEKIKEQMFFKRRKTAVLHFNKNLKFRLKKLSGVQVGRPFIYTQDYVIRCSCRKSLSVRDKKELIFHKRSTISIQLNVWPHSLAHNNNTHTCIHMAFWDPFQAPNTYKSDAFRQ